jgi:hypothetical protein
MIFAFENRSYLGEFEAEFKKDLALESGVHGGYYLMKKTEGQKSCDTVPLRYHQQIIYKTHCAKSIFDWELLPYLKNPLYTKVVPIIFSS